jgi:hypothetical protein
MSKLAKDLIKDAIGNVFDEFENTLNEQEEQIMGNIEKIRQAIRTAKEMAIISAQDVIDEENERIVKLLKKSGINSKQKVIDRLSD